MARLMVARFFTMFLALLISWAPLAHAQSVRSADDDARARHLYKNGVVLYSEGRYKDAIVAWKSAYAHSPRPLLLYNIAEAQERIGLWQEALDTLNRYRAFAPPEEREELTKRISNIERHLQAQPRPQVAPQPTPAPEARSRARPVPVSTPAAAQRWRMGALPITLYAVSGAGALTGAGFAFRAQYARQAASEACVGTATVFCPSSASRAIQADRLSSLIADAGFGVAVTGTVVATVVTIASKNRANRTTMSLTPTVRGASLGLSGSF